MTQFYLVPLCTEVTSQCDTEVLKGTQKSVRMLSCFVLLVNQSKFDQIKWLVAYFEAKTLKLLT